MDTLKPELEWINGSCYRLNPGNYYHHNPGQHYVEGKVVCHHEGCQIDQFPDNSEQENVEEIEGGRYRISFHVAPIYFAYIIGSKGATKKRLENETRTWILIPKSGLGGDIVVTGNTKKAVVSAKTRILMMVMNARKKKKLTHFISISCNAESIQNGFLTFKEEVLNLCKDQGIDETLFQLPTKLHLTICALVLGDDVDRNQAAAALHRCKEQVIRPLLPSDPLKIEVSGVDYMNDDPSAINILYGKVKCSSDPELLQKICDGIVDFFVEQGLSDRERDHVKLHVTLMNTAFAKKITNERQNPFDGRRIIQTFQDFIFGTDIVREFFIYILGSSQETGYYKASASIQIP